jgi:hypothetical protein
MDPTDAHRVPSSLCPVCQHLIDAATAVDDSPGEPEPGDLTVCVECTSFLQFTDTMQVRLMSDKEIEHLPDLTRIWLMRARRNLQRMNMILRP